MVNGEMSVSNLNVLIKESPELKSSILEKIDAKIDELKAMRATISGKSPSDDKESPDTSGNTLKHKEAVLKVLSLAENKNGLSSRDLRKIAGSRYNHVFGVSLGTTLNKMKDEGELKAKPITKGKKQLIYSVA